MPQFFPLNSIKTTPNLGGIISDPGADDTILTTEALPAGKYLCQVTIGVSQLTESRAVFQVQHQDSVGDVLEAVAVVVPFDNTLQVGFMFQLEENEQVAVVSMEDLEAEVYAAINYQRLA